MKRAQAPSYPVSIFMAGDLSDAERVCREYCDEAGYCVTVTATNYVYTRGEEDGFIVGLINYPRFPLLPEVIWKRAEELAAMLCANLDQQSYTIQAPDRTEWFSHRPENDASAAGAGTAETAQQAQGEARQSGAQSADAQPLSSPSPSNHGA